MMAASVASSRGLMSKDMFPSPQSLVRAVAEVVRLECSLLYSQTETRAVVCNLEHFNTHQSQPFHPKL